MAKKPAKSAKATAAEADKTDQLESADQWIGEIDSALAREKNWRGRAKEVVKRYRDERSSAEAANSKVNILWSNTEVLKSALYSRTAKPDVRRRFPDAKKGNTASRYAAETIERTLIHCADMYDVDGPIMGAVEDMLLPGRGVCWVDYDPEITSYNGEEAIGEQALKLAYLYWEDFCHGLARKWCDVPWIARRHAMRNPEFSDKFPNAKKNVGAAAYEMQDASGAKLDTTEADKFTEVWEIWDKRSKRRIYIARGYRDVLQADDDPLQLQGFFPCPPPLYSVTTNDRLVPEPEYCQYQDQAIELDLVAGRIKMLVGEIQWKGIYDASVEKTVIANLPTGGDGTFLPAETWRDIKDKGGIEGVFGFWPIERIFPIVQSLGARQAELIQKIYEVTGISDIIRGSTDPRETKGAQQLKAQFGSMRMQKRQRDVQRFVRDLYRIKAEIIAEHFTSDNLREITQFDLPMKADAPPLAPMSLPAMPQMPMGPAGVQPPVGGAASPLPPGAPSPVPAPPVPGMQPQAGPSVTWDEVMEILRSDKLRGYRVDIETDSTILEDAQAEQQQRVEFSAAFTATLEKAYMAAISAPMMLPLIKEQTLFLVRSYKAGRAMEQAVEDAFDQLATQPPAPPPGQQPEQKAPPVDPMMEAEAKIKRDDMIAAADMKRKDAAAMHEAKLAEQKLMASTALQNKQVMAEASAEMMQPGMPAQPGAMPVASPMETMLNAIMALAQSISTGQQQMAAALAAPKRVVRDPQSGRAVGVETVAPPRLQ